VPRLLALSFPSHQIPLTYDSRSSLFVPPVMTPPPHGQIPAPLSYFFSKLFSPRKTCQALHPRFFFRDSLSTGDTPGLDVLNTWTTPPSKENLLPFAEDFTLSTTGRIPLVFRTDPSHTKNAQPRICGFLTCCFPWICRSGINGFPAVFLPLSRRFPIVCRLV